MAKNQKHDQEPDTTGHQWDGIEEFNNPLPRWWLWLFYLTIIWGIGYTIAYPAWPGIKSASAGLMGWSTRANVAADIKSVQDANAEIESRLASADLNMIKDDPELEKFAIDSGAAVFRTWCAQCHGAGAAGFTGYPNLLDNDWLWGGSMDAIHGTVAHGIRNTDNADARYSEMPAFKDILESEQITQVVNYVMSLSGEAEDASLVDAGKTVFADNCASCHGEDGKGDREQGAPNLSDAIWLYGGDAEALTYTVENARFGVMPAWSGRLSDAQINAVTVYVHQLGGGE